MKALIIVVVLFFGFAGTQLLRGNGLVPSLAAGLAFAAVMAGGLFVMSQIRGR